MNDVAQQFNAVKYAAEPKTFGDRPILTPDQAAMVDKFHETRDPTVLSVLADHFEENGNEAVGQLLRYGVEHGQVVSNERPDGGSPYPSGYHPHVVTGYGMHQFDGRPSPELAGVVRLTTPGSASHNHVVYVPVHRPEVRQLFVKTGDTPHNNGYRGISPSQYYQGTDTEG